MKKIKSIFFLVVLVSILFTLSNVSAFLIDTQTVLNTSISNSSITFSTIAINLPQLDIESTFILLHNATWIRTNFVVNATSNINWSAVNDNIDITEFPGLTFNNNTHKEITSDLGQMLNASITTNVASCNNVAYVNYTSASGLFSQNISGTKLVCTSSNTKLTLNITGIESSNLTNDINIFFLITPSSPDEITPDGRCDILDLRCMFVNELIGSVVIAIVLSLLFYFIVTYKLQLGFDTIITFALPIILILGLAIAGFQIIYAIATVIVALMVAWLFQKMIGNG